MALINLRDALMGGKRLPYDAEVEYLESTGTQYINTDVTLSTSTQFKVDICPTYSTGDRKYLGSDAANFGLAQLNGKWRLRVYGWSLTSIDVVTDSFTTVEKNTNGWFINGTNVYGDWGPRAAVPFLCFAWLESNNTISTASALCRISHLEITDNSTLVRDYIPVRKGTVGYLYDRVSGRLFGNAGTGDFVLGPDVVPVEWLGNGVAGSYINTGVTSSKTISSKVDGIVFNPSVRGSGNFQFIYGKGTSWNYDSYALFFQTESTQTDVGRVSFHGHHNYLSPVLDSETHLSLLISANGTDTATITGEVGGEPVSESASISGVSGYFSMLWARILNQPNTIGLKQVEMYDGIEMIRKFLPVRVGTDATSWEGAMMDVLTRRIYRNAGTGAFTYGNDLKYPIPAA